MSISSIDDLLASGHTHTQPATPEHQPDEPDEIEELEPEEPQYEDEEPGEEDSHEDAEEEREEREPKEIETDEYGNEKEPENKEIRERLKKQAESMERRHRAEIESLRAQLAQQGASPQVQQAAKDFEYDPEASGDWQQQLAQFVKQTVNSMTREQEEARKNQEETHLNAEFEGKFRQGMSKFDDFVDVISGLPFEIDNPMTLATRAMSDPAAFLYAAAKRHPGELERISKMRDPYAKMAEMGKLEERMRKNKPTTKAPRPLGRTTEDSSRPVAKKTKDASGDDLLAKADAKRLNTVKSRLKGNR